MGDKREVLLLTLSENFVKKEDNRTYYDTFINSLQEGQLLGIKVRYKYIWLKLVTVHAVAPCVCGMASWANPSPGLAWTTHVQSRAVTVLPI